jgi:hypothetical protein
VDDAWVLTVASADDKRGNAETGKSDTVEVSFDGRAPDMQPMVFGWGSSPDGNNGDEASGWPAVLLEP